MSLIQISNTAVPPAQARSHPPTFMTLPAEIRLKIFENVFDGITIEEYHDTTWSTRPFLFYRFLPSCPFAIMAVSKDVRREAQVLADRCPIHLDITAFNWPHTHRLPTELKAKITSLRVTQAYLVFFQYKRCFDRGPYVRLQRLEVLDTPKRTGVSNDLRLFLPSEYAKPILDSPVHSTGTNELLKDKVIRLIYPYGGLSKVETLLKTSGVTLCLYCSIVFGSVDTGPAFESKHVSSSDTAWRRLIAKTNIQDVGHGKIEWNKDGFRMIQVEREKIRIREEPEDYFDGCGSNLFAMD